MQYAGCRDTVHLQAHDQQGHWSGAVYYECRSAENHAPYFGAASVHCGDAVVCAWPKLQAADTDVYGQGMLGGQHVGRTCHGEPGAMR